MIFFQALESFAFPDFSQAVHCPHYFFVLQVSELHMHTLFK